MTITAVEAVVNSRAGPELVETTPSKVKENIGKDGGPATGVVLPVVESGVVVPVDVAVVVAVVVKSNPCE